jgi:succinate dehydrogenase/fumarate reductase flavoprotein subunit
MLQRLDSLPEDAGYDVIVLGAGGAGMAAALFAAIEGQRVLLVEHTDFLGGTTAWSAATTWIPNTLHAAGSGDSPEQAATFLDHAVGNHASTGLRRAFLEAGPQAIACLEARTEVKFRARPLHPDYIQEVPGAMLRGRALEPLPFDGRALGPLFPLLRPPIPEFTVLGGMMVDRDDIGHLLRLRQPGKPGFWQSGRHAAGLLARHALDRLRGPRGTRLVMGNALAGRLLLSLARRGVDILVSTRTEALLREQGRVTGLALVQADVRRQVTARRGVILATGGFNRHPTRRAEMLPHPTPQFSPAAPGHTGEMHDLALQAGARYGEGGLDNAFWAPVSVRTRRDGSTAVFPHFVLDRGKPGIIAVNAAGRRFVNEATSYHLFARAMFQAQETVPSIPCFLVTDAEGIRKYGLGMVRPGGGGFSSFLAEGYLHQGATLAELAGKLDVDAAGLEETVARMNRFARAGEDPDFGRGSTAYHRVNGDAAHGPNPNLGSIGTPPFYAIKLWPGDIGAATGLVTDTAARVLDGADQPIPGLYAVGNDMHSIMGGAYPGPGITLGPGITFAWLAARHLAGH